MFLKVENGQILADTKDDEHSHFGESLPPKDGKFFYMSFKHYHDGIYGSRVRVGDMKVEMPVWISTQEHNIGIFSHGCNHCKVKTKWES